MLFWGHEPRIIWPDTKCGDPSSSFLLIFFNYLHERIPNNWCRSMFYLTVFLLFPPLSWTSPFKDHICLKTHSFLLWWLCCTAYTDAKPCTKRAGPCLDSIRVNLKSKLYSVSVSTNQVYPLTSGKFFNKGQQLTFWHKTRLHPSKKRQRRCRRIKYLRPANSCLSQDGQVWGVAYVYI